MENPKSDKQSGPLWQRYAWFLTAVVVALFAINTQSFWIDECCTALCAMQGTPGGVWEQICAIGGSDAQIAFYYYLLFCWHGICGAESELGLRCFNVIWILLAAWFFRRYPKALFVLCISPFFIYYANELRPYILQIAAACGVAVQFYRVSLGEKPDPHAIAGTLLLLCLSSLSSCVWAVGYILGLIMLNRQLFLERHYRRAMLFWVVPFAVLATYYVYTLYSGARAVRIAASSIVNTGAAMYELFGLSGIGAARTELRTCTSLDALMTIPSLWVCLALGILLFVGLIYGICLWRKQSKSMLWWALATVFVLPIAVFCYSGMTMNFRFSGRHFAPLLPLLCLVWAQVLCWNKHRVTRTLFGVLCCVTWIVSDIRLRFCDRYIREDFRAAIEYCRRSEGEGIPVLLLCNHAACEYYRYDKPSDSDPLANFSRYRDIVISRPTDYALLVHDIEQSGMYQASPLCQGFVIYRKINN